MNKTTARLITTLNCNRNCHYCCNTEKMLASATKITDLSELDDYKEVCITGGEPMLYPEKTYDIIKELCFGENMIDTEKYIYRKIYLYTALATSGSWLYAMLKIGRFSGIHYTLHRTSNASDILQGVLNIEYLSKEFTNKSFRLYIDPGVILPVSIRPNLWNRIESFPFKKDCPLPKHEDLFILK